MHQQNPQWLLFDIAASLCFNREVDHRAFATNLKIAEQRTSWSVRLSPQAAQDLGAMVCLDGRSCSEHFDAWGVSAEQREFPVFTALGPVIYLVAHGKWHTLADLPR